MIITNSWSCARQSFHQAAKCCCGYDMMFLASVVVASVFLPWQAILRSQLQPGFLWLSPAVAAQKIFSLAREPQQTPHTSHSHQWWLKYSVEMEMLCSHSDGQLDPWRTEWFSAQTGFFTYSIQEVQTIQEPFRLQGLDNTRATLTPDSTL